MSNENGNGLKPEEVIVRERVCQRCDHRWLPRKANVIPVTCPSCHSAYHNQPRIRPKKVKEAVEPVDHINLD